MDEKEKILIDNFEEYYGEGKDAFQKGKYNSAATLFFKAMVALFDILVLRHDGFVPNSHGDRFRVLEEKHPDMYRIADIDFSFYQDSYTKKIDKETAQLLKDDIERIRKKVRI